MRGAPKIRRTVVAVLFGIAILIQPAANDRGLGVAPASAEHTPNPLSVTIAGSLQAALGCPGDWQPDCASTQLTYDATDDVWQATFNVPAGNWEYKAALNNSWDENYGLGAQQDGPNVPLNLASPSSVKFYYDHKSHWVTDNHGWRIVTAPGSYQAALGCPGDWQPDCLRSWLQDPDGDGTYSLTTTALPAGDYEVKATINESWDENYGVGGAPDGPNIAFSVASTGDAVTFRFVSSTNVLTVITGETGAGHDNDVWWDDLGHDSRNPLYRNPAGAVPAGTPVILRLRAASGDLTQARLRIWDDRNDVQQIVPMSLAADDGTYEWWQATVTAAQPTIYWYRFIAIDGTATAYYEDDEARTGGWGQTFGSSPDNSWQLSVYDPAFQTPEWVKNAVIYQIFPDRFRDGDPANNPAPGQFFYNETPTVFRSHGTDWHTPICDPRNAAGTCPGVYSQNFYGGDLAGILEKLDHIEDLGITALYLNPIFRSPSNHKYDTTDFTQIDPSFGDQALFEELAAELQSRGMRLILDGVFNHSSSDSIYFDRYARYESVGACESHASPYRDWYFFQSVPAGSGSCVGDDGTPAASNYESWFGFDSLPKLRSHNEEVRDFFYQGGVNAVGPYWLSWADGWRLDVAGDVDPGLTNDPGNDYWEGFRAAVRAANPDAYIVGEEWGMATAWTLGNEWDATMNYQLSSALLSFYRDTPFVDNDHNTGSSAGPLNPIAPSQLAERILNLEERYPPEAFLALMNLLGSHDTNRPLFMLDHNADQNNRSIYENPNYDWSDAISRLKGVALLQATLPGAPTVYYGDEVGLVAPPTYDGSSWQDDPYNRIPFPWLDETGTPFYTHLQSEAGQAQLFDHYSLLLGTRNSHASLRTGSLDVLLASDETKTFAYGRKLADHSDAAIVVVNRSDSSQPVDLDVAGYLSVGAQFNDVLNGGTYSVASGGQLSINVAAGGGALLALDGPLASPPESVTDLNVTLEQSTQIGLAWSPATGADSYDIYRSLLSGGGYELVASTGATSYADTGLTTGVNYFYVVVSRDDTTLLTSGHSNEVSGIAQHDLSDPGTSWFNLQWPPTIAHTISSTNRTENIYAQIWVAGVTEATGQAAGIRAQVGFGPEGSQPDASWTWEEMAFNAQAGNNDEYFGSLLPDSTGTFHYATRYSGDGGHSWWLADLNGPQRDGILDNPGVLTVVASDDTTAPSAPSLALSGVTASSVGLSWTESTDNEAVAGYEVFRDGAKIAQLGAATSSFTDETVTTGVTYTYYVKAFDTSFNRSDPSNEIEATAENRIVQVTFKVGVPDYTPDGGVVHVTGSIAQLGPWNPGAFPMTKESDRSWTRTFEIPDGTTFEWKYTRGNWETVEQWGSITGLTNRGPVNVSYGEDGTQLIDNTATEGPDSYRAIGEWRDPLVVSHSPADGATDVALDSTISVDWSKPMASSSSFAVNGPHGAVAGAFALSNGDQSVTFTPDDPLQPASSYTVLVSGHTSAGGDTQQVPLSFSFMTLTPVVVLESITVAPEEPTLRQGDKQDFVATGHYSDGSSSIVAGVSWQTSDKRVISISSKGKANAKKPGTAIISATLDGITGGTNVTVIPKE